MRGVFIGLLSLLILLGSFKEAAIYLSFKLNQNYIAKNLCVEKDIENSTCKGCCQLKEKLDENRAQEEKQVPERQRKQVNPIILDCLSIQDELALSQFELAAFEFNTADSYSYENLFDIFHPPKV